MPILKQNGKTITIDNDGYLLNAADWDETTAVLLAEREGIGPLTQDRMDILKFLREYYRKFNFFPIVRHVCKNVHQPNDCMTDKFLNPVQAWKIAGLPNPGEEVNSFQSWEPLGF